MGALVGISGMTGGYVGSTPAKAMYLGDTLVWSAETTYTLNVYLSGDSSAVITLPINPSALTSGAEITVRGFVQPLHFYEDKLLNEFQVFDINPNQLATIEIAKASGQYKLYWFGGIDQVFYDGIPALEEENISMTFSKDGIYDIRSGNWVASGTNLMAHSFPDGTIDIYVTDFQWGNIQIKDNGVWLFNGVSAQRNSDGQCGFYDTVSREFYTDPDHTIYPRAK